MGMEKENGKLNPIKRFFNLLEVDKKDILNIYIYALFIGLINLSLPLGIQAIIGLITSGQVSTSWIVLVSIVIAGVIITGIFQVKQLTTSERLQQKIFVRSSFEFAYRIPRLKQEEILNKYAPELVNRFFDTVSIQKGLSKVLIDFSAASLQVIFGLILLSIYHPFFILFGVIFMVILFIVFSYSAPKGFKTSLKESTYKYEIAYWLQEMARVMDSFKLAGHSSLPMKKTDELVSGYVGARKQHFGVLAAHYIKVVVFKAAITAGLLILGGILVIEQQMNIGQFVAAEIIIILIFNSIDKLMMSTETIYDVLTSIEKLGRVTDIPLERDNGQKPNDVFEQEGINIEINNFTYWHPKRKRIVLDNVSIKINTRDKILIKGSDCEGKSALLHCLAGMYENFTGNISFNDIPLRNIDLVELRKNIGDTISRERIFKGTVYDNVALGRSNITFNDVVRSVEIVGLKNVIEELENSYETLIIPKNDQYSDDFFQRLVLARCIAGSPKLILLEDHLDAWESDDKHAFIEHLLSVERDWTVIVVSNALCFKDGFNRVLKIENGILEEVEVDNNKG